MMPEVSDGAYDVLIVGGGMVGLTLANTLRDSGLSIGVIEQHVPQTVTNEVDPRVSAISRASMRVFQSANVWDAMVQQRACAFQEMHVWDATGAGSIHFDSAELGLDSLGYIIENTIIQQALLQGLENAGEVDWLCPRRIKSVECSEESHRVTLENGETLSCSRLVGADGAKSLVRAAAGIEFKRSSYNQQGIVCTVTTEQPHAETAWQCFLPTGPLAFLPLVDGYSSIVWSMDESRVEDILALDEASFCRELEQAFGYQLGAVTSASERLAFPLGHGHVNQYVQQGLALIGDAAHNIHPLAGQGANLGFLDAACLAEVILQAKQANRQWWALHTLRKYERARKGDNRLMETSMTGFKILFGNENPLLSMLRNAGLGLTDQIPPLKYQLMKHAMGLDGSA
jgi:2-octaprenylphenol hydroxylase